MNLADRSMTTVCILTEEFYPVMAGVEMHILTLADQLAGRGLGVRIITRRLDGGWPRHAVISGHRVDRLPPQGGGQLKKWLMILPALRWLTAHRWEYDLIYAPHFRTLGIPAVIAGRLLRKPVVLLEAVHGEMSGEIFDQGLRRLRLSRAFGPLRLALRLRNRIIRGADAFVANSAEVAAEYRRHGIPPERIRHIPHGVDTGRFRPPSAQERARIRRRLDIAPDAEVVTYVGRLVTYKGLPMLIDVWERVIGSHADACLILVGSGAEGTAYDCESVLRRSVAERGLGASVRFAGSVRRVEDYLKASDVFVFPSIRDTFAIALVEAMACGLPVIVMPKGGPGEIVTAGHDGLVASDPDEFRGALVRLLGDPSLAGSLGRAARRTVMERYGRDREVAAYLDLFSGLAMVKKEYP
jgi:glycosyltransferase involved in cell wall biosynthesis